MAIRIEPEPDSSAPVEEPSTRELAGRIRAGDRGAEELLVARYSRGLLLFLRVRLGCSGDEADDLHQDSFRIALERLRGQGIEEPEAFAGFLRGIARQLLRNEQRRRIRRRTEADEDALAGTIDQRPGPLGEVLDSEAAGLVRRLITELDATRDREILHRFYIAEDPKETICQDLGLSSLNFNLVLHRARQRFRELLEGFWRTKTLAPSG